MGTPIRRGERQKKESGRGRVIEAGNLRNSATVGQTPLQTLLFFLGTKEELGEVSGSAGILDCKEILALLLTR